MAARKFYLNFEKIFGEGVDLMLGHLWLLGFVKVNSFEWFLKKWDYAYEMDSIFKCYLKLVLKCFCKISRWALVDLYLY